MSPSDPSRLAHVQPTQTRPEPPMRGMSGHPTDGVAFFFGVLFLVCAAAAIALRTVPLGESADGSVARAAAIVLVGAGVVGIGGSLRNHHRRDGRPHEPATAAPVAVDDPAADPAKGAAGPAGSVTDDAPEASDDKGQPPNTWTT